jgi:hypothetical protein
MRIPILCWCAWSLLLGGCGSALVTYEDTDVSHKKTAESMPYYLPKGRIEAAGAWSKDTNTFNITVTPLIEAEKGAPYWVKRNANPFFDDTITLTVNSKGLLQTANVVTQDQTTAAVTSLVSAVGSALSFGAGLGPPMQKSLHGEDVPPPDAILPSVFQCSLDPESGLVSDPIWLEIPVPAGAMRKAVKFIVAAERVGSPAEMPSPSSGTKRPLSGIIVRLGIPYETTVTQAAFAQRLPAVKEAMPAKDGSTQPKEGSTPPEDKWTLTYERAPAPKRVVVLLPDKSHSYILPLSRTPTVGRETNVALVDGTVQTLTMKRESIALGIARVPQTILTALVPIPLNIRQTVTNNLQAVDNGLKAQADIKKLQEGH